MAHHHIHGWRNCMKLHSLSLEQTDIIDEGEQRIAPEHGVMAISFTNCSNNMSSKTIPSKSKKTCFLFSSIGKSFQKSSCCSWEPRGWWMIIIIVIPSLALGVAIQSPLLRKSWHAGSSRVVHLWRFHVNMYWTVDVWKLPLGYL